MKDDNDRLKDDTMPADPLADCEPMETPPGDEMEQSTTLKQLDELLGPAIERIERRARGEEKPIATPWKAVNTALGGGLWPGLVTLTGNTGSGKSQWAMQAALHAAKEGAPVAYVGLELDALGLVCRLVALAMRMDEGEGRAWPPVKWSDLYLGNRPGTWEAHEATRAGLKTLQGLPFWVELGGPHGWTVDELRPLVERLRKEHGTDRPALVVVDFLQIIGRGDGDSPELRERIGQAAYQGRAVARDLDAVVMLVSSTARANYGLLDGTEKDGPGLGKGSASRMVGTGKESGEIEFAADLALALCRKPWGEDEPPPPVYLAVAKQRAGRPQWVQLDFDGCAFTETSKPDVSRTSEGGGYGL